MTVTITPEQYDAIHQAGMDAADAGHGYWDHPYSTDTIECCYWISGWIRRHSEIILTNSGES